MNSIYFLDLDNSNWNYDSTNGVYYQIGIIYYTKPVKTDYQTLAIYIPKEYFISKETLTPGKYKCEINSSGSKGSYTTSNAPIVLPVETPGYAAMRPPTSYNYSVVSTYIEKGIIFYLCWMQRKI